MFFRSPNIYTDVNWILDILKAICRSRSRNKNSLARIGFFMAIVAYGSLKLVFVIIIVICYYYVVIIIVIF